MIIQGRILAEEIYKGLPKTQELRLDVVLVGNDPASQIYVSRKEKRAKSLGINSVIHKLPSDTSQEKLCSFLHSLSSCSEVNGILLQLPLPKHLDSVSALNCIDPLKDVDGLTSKNLGKLTQDKRLSDFIQPCTPLACLYCLESISDFEIEGKNAVVISSSFLVGKPLATLLIQRKATVTVCHKYTKNLAQHVREADIFVVAVGKPNLIPGSWIKKDAVVLDVGINRLEDNTICGDVDFEVAKKRASYITPVPGGIGPLTVAMLMSNTIKAVRLHSMKEGV